MALIKRTADFRKCTVIFIVGVFLIVCGIPLMITGIAATFTASDLVGYVGGISIFFGIGFFLLWYMFTIESKDSMLPIPEYDPTLKTISDVVNKSRAKTKSSPSVGGFSNAAFTDDASEEDDVTASAVEFDGIELIDTPVTIARNQDGKADHLNLSQETENVQKTGTEPIRMLAVPVSLETSPRTDSSAASSRQSIPVEVT